MRIAGPVSTLVVAITALATLAGCSSSSSSDPTSNPNKTDSHGLSTVCDVQCQTNLAEADGSQFVTGPDGRGFQYDTSTCALWNAESSSVRYTLTEVITAKLGGTESSFSFLNSFDKAITVGCASYTADTVKSVATTISNAVEFPR